MTRFQYLKYLMRRIGSAFLVAFGTALLVAVLQWSHALKPADWKWAIRPINKLCLQHFRTPAIRAPFAIAFEFWTWPVLLGFIGHVFFGPKQRRPIYLYYGPGWARAYARVKQDFNAASRGDLITGATGSGKCWHPDTQLMMYDGTSRKVKDIAPGDLLMGPDSTPRRVTNITSGYGPMYRITPRDGSNPWICNDVHILTLRYSCQNGLHRASRAKNNGIRAYKFRSSLENYKQLINESRAKGSTWIQVATEISSLSGKAVSKACVRHFTARRQRCGTPKESVRPVEPKHLQRRGLYQAFGDTQQPEGIPNIVDVPLNDFLARTATRARQNEEGWGVSQYWKLFRVPVEFHASPANKWSSDWFYLAGVWLGDGSSSAAQITTQDPEILQFLEQFATGQGIQFSLYPDKRRQTLQRFQFLQREAHGENVPSFLAQFLTPADPNAKGLPSHRFAPLPLRGAGRAKSIPHEFLTASHERRLSLLAGLIDTDGSLGVGCFDFVSTIPELALQVQWLARSLGLRAAVAKKNTSIKNGPYGGFSGEAWRVTISGELSMVPTKIARKKASPRLQKKDPLMFGWKAESIGDGEYCGFTVEGDGRILMADFTVGHNTQICLNPINETQTIHMRGIERDEWQKSDAKTDYQTLKAQYFEQTAVLKKQLREAIETRDRIRTKDYAKVTEAFAVVLFRYLLATYRKLNGKSLTEAAKEQEAAGDSYESERPATPIGAEDSAPANDALRLINVMGNVAAAGDNKINALDPIVLQKILNETSAAALIAERPLQLPPDAPQDIIDAAERWRLAKLAVLEAEDAIEIIQNKISIRRLELSRAADILRPLRYANYPWGGAVFDQKGNCYQQQQPMLERHDRPEDIIVIQVRPRNAPANWVPANRINILSFDAFPADTYAKIIVDTYNQVEECDKPDPFFVPAARGAIADGIRLLRAIRNAQLGLKVRPPEICVPALDLIYILLKDYAPVPNTPPGSGGQTYQNFMMKINAKLTPAMEKNPKAKPLLNTPELTSAIEQLRTSYWTQPADQLGGVAKTLDNFLAPFNEPAIAEIVCRDNTCQFTDVEKGKIFTISIPQRYALQRVYINTIISAILYQIIQERFDQNKETSFDWNTRNVLRQEKDEAQRLAIKEDTQVDTIREAQGSTGLASQSQDALWKRFGGKEKATEPLSNLRNRFICRAATFNCAEESAKIISKGVYDELSSSGKRGEDQSTSISTKEHYFVSPERILTLPDFNVIFAPADGKFAYIHVVPCPIQPNGLCPPWWYGEANLFKLAMWFLHIPHKFPRTILWIPMPKFIAGKTILWFNPSKIIPFWRSRCWSANKRIGWRYLFGLDTTWYIIDSMTKAECIALSNRRQHLSKG